MHNSVSDINAPGRATGVLPRKLLGVARDILQLRISALVLGDYLVYVALAAFPKAYVVLALLQGPAPQKGGEQLKFVCIPSFIYI